MNNYYKYLNLPFENKLSPVDMQQAHIKLDRQLIDPAFIAWLDSLDIAIGFSEVFQKEPGEQPPHSLHLDGEVFDDHVKINIVVNPGTSVMRWWRLKPGKEHQMKITIVGTSYLWAYQDDCDMVAESELSQPALVNGGQLHNVEQINTIRLCYSFMLINKKTQNRLLWNEAVEIFKDYLK
jgi:hypothetical protein